jgi:purine-cytosine permease-like protein
MAQTPTFHHKALNPVADTERVFTAYSHLSLWFSLGVGLLVIQIGAYLVPAMGTQAALMAIVLGSFLGAGLVAWVAKLGCETGLSSAGLMHAVFGTRFAKLPVALNIVQLVGWTSFELVIMREGTLAMAEQQWGWSSPYLLVSATIFWGAILTLLMASSMLGLVRHVVSKYGLPLVVLSLA